MTGVSVGFLLAAGGVLLAMLVSMIVVLVCVVLLLRRKNIPAEVDEAVRQRQDIVVQLAQQSLEVHEENRELLREIRDRVSQRTEQE